MQGITILNFDKEFFGKIIKGLLTFGWNYEYRIFFFTILQFKLYSCDKN